MRRGKQKSILTVDVTIRYRGAVINLSLAKVMKWLTVIALVAERVYRHLHHLTA